MTVHLSGLSSSLRPAASSRLRSAMARARLATSSWAPRAVPAISSTQLERARPIPERRCIHESSMQSMSEVARAQPASTPLVATVPDAVMRGGEDPYRETVATSLAHQDVKINVFISLGQVYLNRGARLPQEAGKLMLSSVQRASGFTVQAFSASMIASSNRDGPVTYLL
eukprot:6492722-Amphidinium_carterae.2